MCASSSLLFTILYSLPLEMNPAAGLCPTAQAGLEARSIIGSVVFAEPFGSGDGTPGIGAKKRSQRRTSNRSCSSRIFRVSYVWRSRRSASGFR